MINSPPTSSEKNSMIKEDSLKENSMIKEDSLKQNSMINETISNSKEIPNNLVKEENNLVKEENNPVKKENNLVPVTGNFLVGKKNNWGKNNLIQLFVDLEVPWPCDEYFFQLPLQKTTTFGQGKKNDSEDVVNNLILIY